MIKSDLPANYGQLCVKRWKPLLESEAFAGITNPSVLMNTAMVLESTAAEFERKMGKKRLMESVGASAGAGGVFGTYDGQYGKDGDARMPSIVIPTLRRTFPNLIANEVVGVQPMNGPVGFAFALRAMYDVNGKGGEGSKGLEAGYNFVDAAFAGATGEAPAFSGEAASAWNAFAGTGTTPPAATDDPNAYANANPYVFNPTGKGAETANAEWWKFGQDMPIISIKMVKETITAETRKLGANWSMELEEDMAAMHGVDVRGEFVDVIGYELQQQIDRQIIGEIVKSALQAGNVSTWTPALADGRNQQERISCFYTELIRRSNDVAVRSRRGAANFVFASPNVCTMFSSTVFNQNSVAGFKADEKGMLTQNGVSKVGTFVNNGITLYRDTFAVGDYAVLGFKGQTAYDSGIIYCPYIPLQLKELPGSDDLNPRMLVRTRYGITKNLLASGAYYHVISVRDLNSAVTANGDGSGRQFWA